MRSHAKHWKRSNWNSTTMLRYHTRHAHLHQKAFFPSTAHCFCWWGDVITVFLCVYQKNSIHQQTQITATSHEIEPADQCLRVQLVKLKHCTATDWHHNVHQLTQSNAVVSSAKEFTVVSIQQELRKDFCGMKASAFLCRHPQLQRTSPHSRDHTDTAVSIPQESITSSTTVLHISTKRQIEANAVSPTNVLHSPRTFALSVHAAPYLNYV